MLDGDDVPEIADSKRLHMWEAERYMERRLKRQKWNRTGGLPDITKILKIMQSNYAIKLCK